MQIQRLQQRVELFTQQKFDLLDKKILQRESKK